MSAALASVGDDTLCVILTADGEQLVRPIGTELSRVAVEHAYPVREVVSYKQKQSFEGDYWSATLRRLIHHESGLEKQFAVEADFRPNVVAYSSQPLNFLWPRGTRVGASTFRTSSVVSATATNGALVVHSVV